MRLRRLTTMGFVYCVCVPLLTYQWLLWYLLRSSSGLFWICDRLRNLTMSSAPRSTPRCYHCWNRFICERRGITWSRHLVQVQKFSHIHVCSRHLAARCAAWGSGQMCRVPACVGKRQLFLSRGTTERHTHSAPSMQGCLPAWICACVLAATVVASGRHFGLRHMHP